MKFWIRYLREKRYTILLIFATSLVIMAVGWLCQIEHLGLLLYGVILSLFLWLIAGFFDGMAYTGRVKRLEEMIGNFDRFSELLASGFSIREYLKEDGLHFEESTLGSDMTGLLDMVCEQFAQEKRLWEEKNADRNDYYVMWTHQIKTPIAALRLLLEDTDQGPRDNYLMREELFKIEQYAEMALAYQRLESLSSDLVLQEYDLYALLKQAVKKFSVLFINKGLSLELEPCRITVVTDEKWFGFCLEQFLSNSIKYTNQGRITIFARTEGSRIRLCLEDTGIGIRPEDLPRIFERGFTGYNGRLDRRSTGIGLYLCRLILDHLGITVDVESKTGEGTRVILFIPTLTKM